MFDEGERDGVAFLLRNTRNSSGSCKRHATIPEQRIFRATILGNHCRRRQERFSECHLIGHFTSLETPIALELRQTGLLPWSKMSTGLLAMVNGVPIAIISDKHLVHHIFSLLPPVAQCTAVQPSPLPRCCRSWASSFPPLVTCTAHTLKNHCLNNLCSTDRPSSDIVARCR